MIKYNLMYSILSFFQNDYTFTWKFTCFHLTERSMIHTKLSKILEDTITTPLVTVYYKTTRQPRIYYNSCLAA